MKAAMWTVLLSVGAFAFLPVSLVVLVLLSQQQSCSASSTPAAPPPPANVNPSAPPPWSQAQMQAAIAKFDPKLAQIFGAIGMAESGGSQFPSTNPTGVYHGPWAMQEQSNPGLDFHLLDMNLNYAAQQAVLLQHRAGWNPWQTYTNGMYLRFMGSASQQAQAQPVAATSPAPPSTSSTCATSTSMTMTAAKGGVGGYINPLSVGNWGLARIDEGVDYIPNTPSPVVAIGDGVITASMPGKWGNGVSPSGWMTYRLSTGSHAGLLIFVAEHIMNMLPTGTVVKAGQQIALALPGYPWTEWGWADPNPAIDQPAVPPIGGQIVTASGLEFARFLKELGTPVISDPGPGPDRP